ncbi:MAG: SMC-Scp complex subunit ScpB [Opitutaceae bacterium]|nr:SMC-Scp complex subunit ScpB [Opitutaceae bacterium]
MAFDLRRVLKVLLFASPGPLTVKGVQAVFTRFHEQAISLPEVEGGSDEEHEGGSIDISVNEVPSLVTATQIREAMQSIEEELNEKNEVFRLMEAHNGYRLATSTDCAEWVRLLRDDPKPIKLRQAALETLAVIAYRQPVVRSEIENIRGVSIENALMRLMERDLIRVEGRADLPGRPLQYGTTEVFLEFVGIKSLEELPASDVLSHGEIDSWLDREKSSTPATDEDMGLSSEEGETDSVDVVADDTQKEALESGDIPGDEDKKPLES